MKSKFAIVFNDFKEIVLSGGGANGNIQDAIIKIYLE
jgi:hypothetical protein